MHQPSEQGDSVPPTAGGSKARILPPARGLSAPAAGPGPVVEGEEVAYAPRGALKQTSSSTGGHLFAFLFCFFAFCLFFSLFACFAVYIFAVCTFLLLEHLGAESNTSWEKQK